MCICMHVFVASSMCCKLFGKTCTYSPKSMAGRSANLNIFNFRERNEGPICQARALPSLVRSRWRSRCIGAAFVKLYFE